MLSRLLTLAALLLTVTALLGRRREEPPATVPDRENEPEAREYEPVKMPAVVGALCEGIREHLRDQSSRGIRVKDEAELTHSVVSQLDRDGDGCIAGAEIREVARVFGGSVNGYRVLFEHVLDEDRDGCVGEEELATIVQDCMRPMTQWTREGAGDKEYLPIRAPEEDNTVEEEEEEEVQEILEEEVESVEEEEAISEEEEEEGDESRREAIEAAKADQLNRGVKELICAVLRRRERDVEVAAARLFETVGAEATEGMDSNQFYEFLAGARVPRVETDDLIHIMDSNADGLLTTEELLSAVDNCPTPEEKGTIPVVKTKPFIRQPEVECPGEREQYKALRTLAMKFLGRQEERTDVRMLAEKFYTSITGDIEGVITPRALDIPESCVKECWRDLDSNQDGLLNLHEFSRISYDILEEFVIRPAKKEVREEERRPVLLESLVSQEDVAGMDGTERAILTGLIVNMHREMGVPVGEEDALRIAAKLRQNEQITPLLRTIQDLGPNSEAYDSLKGLVRPVVERLARH